MWASPKHPKVLLKDGYHDISFGIVVFAPSSLLASQGCCNSVAQVSQGHVRPCWARTFDGTVDRADAQPHAMRSASMPATLPVEPALSV
eukprot:7453408-Alexandrium_andersonii.AAC.1